MKSDTSWEHVAGWYDEFLETSADSYQKNIILPNLLRIVHPKKGMHILDLACGQGFFSRTFAAHGADVIGIDASAGLIEYAKKRSQGGIAYHVAQADNIAVVQSGSMDAVVIILALQNIKNISGVFVECRRVLKKSGRIVLVLNHPVFRIPKQSSWGWDDRAKIQFRRIDRYLTEMRIAIDMHPGIKQKETTISFHRPLQTYVNTLAKHNCAIMRMEEWISDKKSARGPRQIAENQSRKEIPLFLMIEGCVLSESA